MIRRTFVAKAAAVAASALLVCGVGSGSAGAVINPPDADGDVYVSAPSIWYAGAHTQTAKADLRMQWDGNLVVYDENGTARWASGTYGSSDYVTAQFQSDGNLVLYKGFDKSNPIWASGTYGNPGAYLKVQADGNVVIYRSNGTPIWATGTYH